MMGIGERLAIVETQLERLFDESHSREDVQREMLQKIAELNETITEMNGTLAKYKGFVGGVVFLATAIGTFLFKFIGPVWAVLSGKVHA